MAKRQLSEETLRKRAETFRKHLFEKAEKEVGKKYNHFKILEVDYEKTNALYDEGKRYGAFVKCQCDCENKTINNLKSNNFKFIDDSIQFNKSIFEIDFSTEIYFKMGGEIEFIKIFN